MKKPYDALCFFSFAIAVARSIMNSLYIEIIVLMAFENSSTEIPLKCVVVVVVNLNSSANISQNIYIYSNSIYI